MNLNMVVCPAEGLYVVCDFASTIAQGYTIRPTSLVCRQAACLHTTLAITTNIS